MQTPPLYIVLSRAVSSKLPTGPGSKVSATVKSQFDQHDVYGPHSLPSSSTRTEW